MELCVALRPEKMTLTPGHTGHPHNALFATVATRSYMGSYTAYELNLQSKRNIRVTVSNANRYTDPFKVGDPVTAVWSDSAPVVITD